MHIIKVKQKKKTSRKNLGKATVKVSVAHKKSHIC